MGEWGPEVAQCCTEHIKGEEVLPVPNWSVLLDTGLAWEAIMVLTEQLRVDSCVLLQCVLCFLTRKSSHLVLPKGRTRASRKIL